MEKLLFTSESVTEGHPDKMCDAISDAILDACMEQDPMSRVACETASCTGFVLVTGEITTKAQLDIPSIVRKTVNEIGYNDAKTGFDGHTCAVMVALDQQSPDIAMGVDKALEAKENKMSDEQLEAIGAGDQAADIADLSLRLEDADISLVSKHLPAMVANVKTMVKDAIHAFTQRDTETAETFEQRDDLIDAFFERVKREVIEFLKKDGDKSDVAVDLLMVAKYLERIADHAVNVCEWTEFSDTGAVGDVMIL